MLRALSLLPLALLFLASVVPSNGQITIPIPLLPDATVRRSGPDPNTSERQVSVKLGAPLTVECTLQPQQKVEWKLDGGARPSDMKPVETTSSPDVVIARLTVPAASAHHAGVYTCAKSSPRIRVNITGTEATTTLAPTAPENDFEGTLKFYEVRGGLELNCSKLKTGKIVWSVNNTELAKREDLKDHLTISAVEGVEGGLLKVNGRATEQDFGNYSCSNGDETLGFMVKANLHAKMPTDSNVVEGQTLKLSCKVIGRPCVGVKWTYSNASAELANITVVDEAYDTRVTLSANDQGIPNAELSIKDAVRGDAGWYMCTPEADTVNATVTPFVTQLRVKDMYAALWPFLGICAEVFVLCAVILVYEKRRTKPELDDSDTDNHDQKKS